MNQLDPEQVKRRVDIVKLIEQSGTKLKSIGPDNFVGLCPFHQDKNPSLSVTASKGLYHCFGCEASGDAISFVQRKEGADFPEALRQVANSAGMAVPATAAQPRSVNGKPPNGTKNQTIRPAPIAPQTGDQKPAQLVAKYPYTDEEGNLLFEVLRFDPKSFLQRRPDPASPDGWLWKLGDVRRVLLEASGKFLDELVARDERADSDDVAALVLHAQSHVLDGQVGLDVHEDG